MATPIQVEIESFVGKFIQLSFSGYAADLSFSTNDGNICVNFQASLCSSSLSSDESFHKRVKPSRIRRRQRRKERRENHSSTSSNPNETPVLIQPATSDESQTNLFKPFPSQPPDAQLVHVCDGAVMTSVPSQVDSAALPVKAFKDASCNTESIKPVTLTTSVNPSVSIPPQQIYHPAVINASKSLYKRHPRELTKEEFKAFNKHLHNLRNNGHPVELDPLYLPTATRDCLHCGHPT